MKVHAHHSRETDFDDHNIARELDEAPFYLESEYVAGGNLRDWATDLGRLSALPLEERLRLVAEIAKAVSAAHSVGIIHKDLKPTNVFIRYDGAGRCHPILTDFGIGAVADRSQLERRGITVTGFTQSLLEPGSSRTGTRMYQPPEANLAHPATVQGDVYALGVLLYQIILGDFDQPLGIGWERRLEKARKRGWVAEPPPAAPAAKSASRSHPRGEGARRAGEGAAIEAGLQAESAFPLESRLQAVPGPAKAGTPTPHSAVPVSPEAGPQAESAFPLESRLQAVPGTG